MYGMVWYGMVIFYLTSWNKCNLKQNINITLDIRYMSGDYI